MNWGNHRPVFYRLSAAVYDPGTLLRISISWVVLLFILFSMAMAFTWGLRHFMNRHK
jgi:hypothetical protein